MKRNACVHSYCSKEIKMSPVEGRSVLDVAATNLFGGGCLKKFGLAYKIYMTMLGRYLYDCRVYKQCTGSLPLFQFFQSRFTKWWTVENIFGQTRPSSVKHCRNIVCTLDNCKMFFKPPVGPKNTFLSIRHKSTEYSD